LAKRRRDMGLGPLEEVALAAARDAATEARKLVRAGVDPIASSKQATVARGLLRWVWIYRAEYWPSFLAHSGWFSGAAALPCSRPVFQTSGSALSESRSRSA